MKIKFRIAILAATPLLAQVSPTINELPSREYGHIRLQSTLTTAAPNLVEGKELNGPSSIAFDTSVSPPILYVADTFNNRILAWQNAFAISKGNPADKVIGQRDFNSTLGLGPGTSLTTGLNSPVAVAVDRSGNLYVADAGNNRIIRYPAPFRQSGDLLPVDLVIGQQSIGATVNGANNVANQGGTLPSPSTIFLSQNGTIYRAGMTFDAQGNLWFTDAGNNRVLRYPVRNLVANAQNVSADLVLGQGGFNSNIQAQQPTDGSNIQLVKTQMTQPSSVAFDEAGRLFVADALGRVLQFAPPNVSAVAASRVLGIRQNVAQGQLPQSFPAANTLGNVTNGNLITGAPQGVFTLGNNLFVADTVQHRIVRYEPADTWAPETLTSPSPAASSVIGQATLNQGKANRGNAESNDSSLNLPVTGAILGNDVWVVDTGNNRILAFSPVVTLGYTNASRVLGQFDFNYNSPNLLEGRELFINQTGFFSGAGIVVDRNSDPPRLYVADSLNNRVLGFRDARAVGTDTRSILNARADIVIGQGDLMHSTANYPGGDAQVPTPQGLLRPVGLAVDAAGNLYVADSGNGRVIRFPNPFLRPQISAFQADLVLGQFSANSKIQDASSGTMNAPFGLALFTDGSLAVSDAAHNRILLFRRPTGGDFSTGQAAAVVLGQQDFITISSSTSLTGLNSPRHLSVDTSDRLYVADAGNNRVMVFPRALFSANGTPAAFGITGFSNPQSIAVSPITGEIWVTNSGQNQVVRFPEYQQLVLNPSTANALIGSAGPMTVALDPFDNIIVAEATNRLTFYYAKATYQHAASYNQQPLSPGQLAYLYRLGKDFSLGTAAATSYPWPSTLNDVQVQIAGQPAKIFRVNPTRIDFQVPSTIPTSGSVDVVVVRPSTGQILAASTFPVSLSSPGFFTANAAGTGQVAALNDDGVTVNNASNPVGRGKVISLFLTGAGNFLNAPQDGMPPSGLAPTPVKPKITFIPGPATFLPDSAIQYSGNAAFPGGWQINVVVPEEVPPSNNVQVVLTQNDIPSNIGPTSRITTTIAVK